MLVKTLRLTVRLLMLTLGVDQFMHMLEDYWEQNTPEIFATSEGIGFANFLYFKNLDIPYLYDILDLELANISAIINGGAKRIRFQYDPRPILNDLSKNRLPTSHYAGKFEAEVTSHDISVRQIFT
jgi:hypothetical protein